MPPIPLNPATATEHAASMKAFGSAAFVKRGGNMELPPLSTAWWSRCRRHGAAPHLEPGGWLKPRPTGSAGAWFCTSNLNQGQEP